MAKWKSLRATFPEEEFEEIKRIKEEYKISYNEIVRSGVKFYVGLTLLKELVASTDYAKDIKFRDKTLSEILENPESQAKIVPKMTKIVKTVGFDLFEKAFEFSELTSSLTVERKVGRPKKPRKVGRPKQ
jgi:phage antirepressor YoqD-like protein